MSKLDPEVHKHSIRLIKWGKRQFLLHLLFTTKFFLFLEIERLSTYVEPEYLEIDVPKPIRIVKKILVPVHRNPKVCYLFLFYSITIYFFSVQFRWKIARTRRKNASKFDPNDAMSDLYFGKRIFQRQSEGKFFNFSIHEIIIFCFSGRRTVGFR